VLQQTASPAWQHRPVLQQPRTDQIRLRVSPAEKAKIAERAEASGLGMSDYIRTLALGEIEVEAVKPVGKVSPPAAPPPAAVPPPATSSPPSKQSPPAADLEAKVEALATQIYGREGIPMMRARRQARRELS
jgi:hypothetical protein